MPTTPETASQPDLNTILNDLAALYPVDLHAVRRVGLSGRWHTQEGTGVRGIHTVVVRDLVAIDEHDIPHVRRVRSARPQRSRHLLEVLEPLTGSSRTVDAVVLRQHVSQAGNVAARDDLPIQLVYAFDFLFG